MKAWKTVPAGLLLAICWIGCEGDVTTEDDGAATSDTTGSGASGATGAQGGTGASGGSTTTANGGAGNASGGTGASGGASMDPCFGLFEAECLANYPACAPVYDDACCPSCEPGPCADCSNPEFHHCAMVEDACVAKPQCGLVPEWACIGAPHICPEITDPGNTYECDATPGCVVGQCSPDVNCIDTECIVVTGDSCTALCRSRPPSCPPGMTAEADGNCWTGFCIPAAVCGVF